MMEQVNKKTNVFSGKIGGGKYLLVSALLLTFSLSSCTPGGGRQAAVKGDTPNIILIMSDDQGYETLQCYGSAEYQTTNLDRLAETGVRFDRAYSNPLCTPSRVKIMTGQYNFRNYFRFGSLRAGEYTIGHLAKSAGYKTLVSGKWQLSERNYHEDPLTDPYHFGFDEYCLWQLMPGDYHRRYKNPIVMQNGRYLKDIYGKYGPDIYTGAITNFIEKHQDEPFFIYYPMALPHKPWVPTPDSPDFEAFYPYDGGDTTYFKDMIAYIDKLVGRIVNKLEETGVRDNTLILFTGDNGTGREIQSSMQDGSVIWGQKGLPLEHGTHVPLIANWKGTIPGGQVNGNLVGFSDVLPTLAEAMGVRVPDSVPVDGISFYRQMTGQEGPRRQFIYSHYRPGKGGFPPSTYVHNKTWKLYENGDFYNMEADPLEKRPIASGEMTPAMRKEKQWLQAVLDSIH